MPDAARKELIAANLRYGRSAAGLRTRAYAQIVVKAFLLNPKDAKLKLERLRLTCGEILEQGTPSRAAILTALEFLMSPDQGLVVQNGPRYSLRSAAWDELHGQIQSRRTEVDRVLESHFQNEIEPDVLRAWFEMSGIEFFAAFSDRWVASVARNSTLSVPSPNIEQIAVSTARRFALSEGEQRVLAHQFTEFLASREPEDAQVMWHFGRAMFAARLMVADLAADPIAASEFAHSKLFLDTNVLLAFAVGRSEVLPALEGLGHALDKLGISIGYVHETREEYRGVVGRWREETLRELDRHGFAVLSKAEDAHIRAAVERGYVRRDEFEAHYDALYDPPGTLGGIAISFWDDPVMAGAAAAGSQDPELVQQIQHIWAENRPYQKRIGSARHDAAVTAAARHIRSTGSSWVLTTDRTMHRLSIRWAGKSAPLWIPLDTLVQVLAVEEEGSGLDATVFAPLLVRLISSEVQSLNFGYRLEDLQILDEVIQGAENLSTSQVQTMSRRIHLMLLRGADRDDPELHLEINRIAQRAKRTMSADVATAREAEVAARRAQEEAEAGRQNEVMLRKQTEEQLREERIESRLPPRQRELTRRAWMAFLRSVPVMVMFLFLVVAIVILVWYWATPGAGNDALVGLFVDLLAFVAVAVNVFTRKWNVLQTKLREAPEEARRQLKEEIP